MSEPTKAVFLSYASQDAEAAKRIAEALRAAGVEVWFDQNELVGGDAWDQKIRKQIKECALLVPIISANTQSRTEGYFRLEWRLADQRTHLMAKGRPFLLPVVIDDTRDSDAHVPDSFLEVQWTKASGGAVPPAFAARVKKLLSGEPVGGVADPGQAPASPRPATAVARSRGFRWWWLAPILGVAVVLALMLRENRKEPAPPPAAPAAAPVTEARKLAEQAMQLLNDPNLNRESSWLADELCERALKLDAADAEVWAVASLASCNLASNIYDTSSARREKARAQSERAVQLDRQSVRASLAVARYEQRFGSDAAAYRQLQQLAARAPENPEVLHSLARAAGEVKDEAAVQAVLKRLRALPRTPLLPHTLWFECVRLRGQGRFAEAEQVIAELLRESPPIRAAFYEQLWLLLGPWHKFEEVDAFLREVPERFMQEPAFGSFASHYRLWRGDPAGALAALDRVPLDYFEEFNAREPKALAAGWAHQQAGRAAAAQSEWRGGLALVEERLRQDPRSGFLLAQRALLLALTGQPAAAREARRLWLELSGHAWSGIWANQLLLQAALGEREEAIAGWKEFWASLEPGRRVILLAVVRYDPAFAEFRTDARFQRLLDEAEQALQNDWRAQGQSSRDHGGLAVPAPGVPAIDDKSVAVLAFANLSDDKGNEYFSDGISEELLNVLAKVPGLKVSARTSAFYFKGKEVPVPDIAKQLGVAYIVEGSVRKAGDKVRITAQLIKAADGFHVWSDTFTRDLKDVFAVQDEIAGLIAKNLSLKMGVTTPAPSLDAEVLPLYYAALQAWNLRTVEGMDHAEELLNRALALAPDFARGHAALANVWTIRGELTDTLSPFGLRAGPLARKIQQKVDQALALDPACAEAYGALGVLCWDTWRSDEAVEALRHAARLNPNYASAHQWLGRVLTNRGYLDEGLASLQRAAELDPLSQRILDNYGRLLLFAGRPREALEMAERALVLLPGAPQVLSVKAMALQALGRTDDAAQLARSLPSDRSVVSIHKVQVLAASGNLADLEPMLPKLTGGNLLAKIGALTALRRIEEAMAAFDPDWITANRADVLLYAPLFDPLRTEPRFHQALATLGLNDAEARAQAWRAAHRTGGSAVKP